jgi:hypothetical protein
VQLDGEAVQAAARDLVAAAGIEEGAGGVIEGVVEARLELGAPGLEDMSDGGLGEQLVARATG